MKKVITTKSYTYNIETSEGIELSKIWRNDKEPKETSFEYKFNDPNKYIIGSISNTDNFKFNTTVLEQYPEYLDGWDTIITNTGLTAFYKEDILVDNKLVNRLVIYDMFDDDSSTNSGKSKFRDIIPDIGMILQYDMFNQPLSVRKINFIDNIFVPDRVFKSDSTNFFSINCDKIDGLTQNNIYFTTTDTTITNFDSVGFFYKPVFVIKVFDQNGNEIELTNSKIVKAKIKDTNGKNYTVTGKLVGTSNICYFDLSEYNFKDDEIIYFYLENCGSGFLEVI